MNENFLLTTPLARSLFHDCAQSLPIIDYHNHLAVQDLVQDRRFENLAQLWLLSDPYKHRAMRICGVPEHFITGEASDYEKFSAWMQTLPKLVGNALYDWSILEMKRIFDLDLVPGVTDTAWLWQQTEQMLSQPGYTARALLDKFHVEYAAPCAAVGEAIDVYRDFENLAPSLRADDLLVPTAQTLHNLEHLTGLSIRTREDFRQAVVQRLDSFLQAGCRFADHALDNGFCYRADDGRNDVRFAMLCSGAALSESDTVLLASDTLRFLAAEYAKRGWTMQLHIGAQRTTSTRLRQLAGPAGGFAGIGSGVDVTSLTRMLDDFEQSSVGMPRILLFTLNPADNAVMSILSGSYSQDGVAGKVQQGPAWWWCDHLQGMREVFEHIAAYGVLWVFIGMTTDSRSLLSFVRHEYFRRAFCGWLGEKAARGEINAPAEQLKQLVYAVCYGNAKHIATGGKNDAF